MFSLFGFFMVLLAVLFWAGSSVGYKYSLGSVGSAETKSRDPISSMVIRISILIVTLLIMVLAFGNLPSLFTMNSDDTIHWWIVTILAGIFTVLGDLCYFFALRFLDSSRVYPMINTQILFTFPFAYLLFHEDITPMIWLAAAFMICGVFFIRKPDSKDKGMENLSPEVKRRNHILGISLGIGTGFFFALIFLMMREQNVIHYGILEGNLGRTLVYAVIIWTFALIRRKHIPRLKSEVEKINFKAYLIMGLFGILSFAFGDSIYQLGVKANGNAISIIIASSAPILNQVFSIAFLKEKFRPNFLIGVAFIVIGNILAIF